MPAPGAGIPLTWLIKLRVSDSGKRPTRVVPGHHAFVAKYAASEWPREPDEVPVGMKSYAFSASV